METSEIKKLFVKALKDSSKTINQLAKITGKQYHTVYRWFVSNGTNSGLLVKEGNSWALTESGKEYLEKIEKDGKPDDPNEPTKPMVVPEEEEIMEGVDEWGEKAEDQDVTVQKPEYMPEFEIICKRIETKSQNISLCINKFGLSRSEHKLRSIICASLELAKMGQRISTDNFGVAMWKSFYELGNELDILIRDDLELGSNLLDSYTELRSELINCLVNIKSFNSEVIPDGD